MKPPPFDYLRAATLDDVWDALENEDAKVIAGGQSLVPLLSLRFASPSLLVDITGLDDLAGAVIEGEILRIGALTRHSEVENGHLIRTHCPLLSEAATWVAHPQIRNRGTIGGSVAHSDSAAEFPAALLALDATLVAASREGQRRIPADEFFHSYFTTALRTGELLHSIEVPIQSHGARWGFSEFARRRGDYAIGGAAVQAVRDAEGRCTSVRAGLIAAGPAPTLAPGLSETLVGARVDVPMVREAVAAVLSQIRPGENVHGTAEYRREVIGETLRRALTAALELGEAA